LIFSDLVIINNLKHT